jgi:hypothetical protein
MLAQLENKANCSAILALAEHLPLLNGALDCLFTFNAVHHFRLQYYINELCQCDYCEKVEDNVATIFLLDDRQHGRRISVAATMDVTNRFISIL